MEEEKEKLRSERAHLTKGEKASLLTNKFKAGVKKKEKETFS